MKIYLHHDTDGLYATIIDYKGTGTAHAFLTHDIFALSWAQVFSVPLTGCPITLKVHTHYSHMAHEHLWRWLVEDIGHEPYFMNLCISKSLHDAIRKAYQPYDSEWIDRMERVVNEVEAHLYDSIRLRVFDTGAMLIETLPGDFVCAYETEIGWYPCRKYHERQWIQTDKLGDFDDDVMLEMMQITSRYQSGYKPEGGE